MDATAFRARATSPSSIYIAALPFSWDAFAGISRYTARLALALSAYGPVRFFHKRLELLAPPGLSWSQDQDLEDWGRAVWSGRRRPLGTPAANSIGLHCLTRPSARIFPYEATVLHDFCTMVVPWAFKDDDRDGFVKFLTEDILSADLVLADSHSTKADAAWFSPFDAEQIVVASPGPSLCVETHCHRDPVARSDHIGLVVSTIEPRKNASFLLDWFQKTTLLPPDIELWWVGKLGWMISEAELERLANPAGGRRVRFLGSVSDAELCRLYQMAAWSIYPSLYEGFGFPILDSLRHGTPVLSSCTSSMREFDHPGVFFFDPHDPATVDVAWQRFQENKEPPIPRARLDELYSWDGVARAILDAHARSIGSRTGAPTRRIGPEFGGVQVAFAGAGSLPCFDPGPQSGAFTAITQHAGMRIGIGLFGTQIAERNRGIRRYSRSLVATLLTRDRDNHYVLYGWHEQPTNQVPPSPNAVVHLLRPDAARGEATLAHALESLVATNPHDLDVLLLLNALGMTPGCDLPAKPSNGLKMAAIICDLIPVLFDDDSLDGCPAHERIERYLEKLNRLARYDVLLAVSEATRSDLLSLLRMPHNRIVNIGTASDGQFFVPDQSDPMPTELRALFQKLGITGPFILSVGSLEYQHRDNLLRVIEAFAMLPVELRQAHQLVLTYDLSSEGRKQVRQCASDRGVADRLVITDRLADKALRVFYQRCAAFVSVTSYEELGLPILEAMRCGAPVIVGNTAAQMEVAGDAGLFFNVTDAAELANRLALALNAPGGARLLRERALVQSGRFRWDQTVDTMLHVLTGQPRNPRTYTEE